MNFTTGGTTSTSSHFLQRVYFTLQFPIAWLGDVTMTNWILLNISPFRRIKGSVNRCIPKVSLPQFCSQDRDQLSGDLGFPPFHPSLERNRSISFGFCEEMNVVGKNDEFSNDPSFRFLPKLSHVIKRIGMAKDFLTIFCAYCQKNNSFIIMTEIFEVMRGFASDFHERLNTGVGERLQGIINGTTWKSSFPWEVENGTTWKSSFPMEVKL